MLKAKDDVIIVYAVMTKEQWGKVSLPHGSFAKAIEVGAFEQLVQMQECKNWGIVVAMSLHKLAHKLLPEIVNSPIIQLGKH